MRKPEDRRDRDYAASDYAASDCAASDCAVQPATLALQQLQSVWTKARSEGVAARPSGRSR